MSRVQPRIRQLALSFRSRSWLKLWHTRQTDPGRGVSSNSRSIHRWLIPRRCRIFVGAFGLLSVLPSCSGEVADASQRKSERGGTGGAIDGMTGAPGVGGGSSSSVEQYCSENDCSLPSRTEYCSGVGAYWVTSSGCGYHRVAFLLDQVSVWEESTGELIYHYSLPAGSTGDLDAVRVGTEPSCDAYEVICDTTYACSFPPHLECHGNCHTGCLPPGVEDCYQLCGSSGGGVGGAP